MPSWILFPLACAIGRAVAQDIDFQSQDDFFQFVTRPDILAPKWNITIFDQDALGPGHFFVAPYANLIQKTWPLWNGPMIYDSVSGELIWSGAPFVKDYNTFDFRVSRINGHDMLTFIWPRNSPEQEAGFIMDNNYEVYKLLDMNAGQIRPNMHDFHFIEDGKRALMLTMPHQSPSHITVPGEYDGTCKVEWQGFKEVDVATNEILFEWNAQGILSVGDTTYFEGDSKTRYYKMCDSYWDITHFNAIDKFADGDYLLSSRHMDTIYKISHKDHSVVWRLGGVKSDFVFKDQRAIFSRQHHARIRSENSTHILISLFDNAVGDYPLKASAFESWGLLVALHIDTSPPTVSLVSRYQKPFSVYDALMEKARGSVSFLPNGNALVGWPTASQIGEYAPNGLLLMHAAFRRPEAASYRAYKLPWIGRPAQPPDVQAAVYERTPGQPKTEVYVSWNGDTETAMWNLLRTDATGNASELVFSAPRHGFETKLVVEGITKRLIAVALDNAGRELGRSGVIRTRLPQRFEDMAAAEEAKWLQTHPSAWQPAPSEMTQQESPAVSNWTLFLAFVAGTVACVLGVVRLRKRHRRWHRRQQSYDLTASEEDEYEESKKGRR